MVIVIPIPSFITCHPSFSPTSSFRNSLLSFFHTCFVIYHQSYHNAVSNHLCRLWTWRMTFYITILIVSHQYKNIAIEMICIHFFEKKKGRDMDDMLGDAKRVVSLIGDWFTDRYLMGSEWWWEKWKWVLSTKSVMTRESEIVMKVIMDWGHCGDKDWYCLKCTLSMWNSKSIHGWWWKLHWEWIGGRDPLDCAGGKVYM